MFPDDKDPMLGVMGGRQQQCERESMSVLCTPDAAREVPYFVRVANPQAMLRGPHEGLGL